MKAEDKLHELLEIENLVEWYDRLYREYPYEPPVNRQKRRVADFVKRFFPQLLQLRLLDYGCGNGRYFPMWHGFNFDTIGAEISIEAARMASKNEYGFPVLLTDGRTLPFSEKAFDVIVCIGVMPHLRKDILAQLREEFWRVLKEGGLLAFSVVPKNVAKNRKEVGKITIDPRWKEPKPSNKRLRRQYMTIFSTWQHIETKDNREWFVFRKVEN